MFKGVEDRLDLLKGGVENSVFCPEDPAKLKLKNNIIVTGFPGGTSTTVWLDFSTC